MTYAHAWAIVGNEPDVRSTVALGEKLHATEAPIKKSAAELSGPVVFWEGRDVR